MNQSRFRWPVIAMSLLIIAPTAAHEGHAALPTRGAKVDLKKGTIVLASESRKALGVETSQVDSTPIRRAVFGYASMKAQWDQHAFVSPGLTGRIVALKGLPGQKVKSGDVLAEVESSDLESLRQDALQAKIEHELAKQLLESLRESSGSVAGQAIFSAENSVIQQKNRLDIARIKWRSLGLPADQLEGYLSHRTNEPGILPIKAPIDGTIVHSDVAIGRVVEPGQHLFEIVNLSSLWARIGILEPDLNRIHKGDEVELRLTARPSESLKGHVALIGSTVQGPDSTIAAWAKFANENERLQLMPGMTGTARIIQQSKRASLVIPASALVDNGVSQFVLVEEVNAEKQSEYRRSNVTVVHRTATAVEVASSGLFPGDRVVTKGASQLGGFFIAEVFKLSPEALATLDVRFDTVKAQPYSPTIPIEGVVELPPGAWATASSVLPGIITAVEVRPAQSVKRGETLARVRSLELQSKQLDMLRAFASQQIAERQLQSIDRVRESISRTQVIELESAVSVAKGQLESARRQLQLAGLAEDSIKQIVASGQIHDSIPIVAPIDGVISDVTTVIGQSIKAQEPLLEIQDLRRAAVKAFVAETDVRNVSIGQSASIRLRSRPETTFAGRLTRSSRMFAAGDQSLAVWIELTQTPDDLSLLSRQLVSLSLERHTETASPVLSIQHEAVIRSDSRAFVFTQRADGTFERKEVRLGRSNDRAVEVLNGLSPGDRVVVRGAAGLQTAYANVR